MPSILKRISFLPTRVRRGSYLELMDGKFGKHVEQIPEELR